MASNSNFSSDLLSVLQNNNLQVGGGNVSQPQYNELVNVLMSALAEGRPASFKIGNQTISINIMNGNQTTSPQMSEAQQSEEPLKLQSAEATSQEDNPALKSQISTERTNLSMKVNSESLCFDSPQKEKNATNTKAELSFDNTSPINRHNTDPQQKNKLFAEDNINSIRKEDSSTNMPEELSPSETKKIRLHKDSQENDEKEKYSFEKVVNQNIQSKFEKVIEEKSDYKDTTQAEKKVNLEPEFVSSSAKKEEHVMFKGISDEQIENKNDEDNKDSIIDIEEEKDQIDTTSLFDDLIKISDPVAAINPLYNKIRKIVNKLHRKEKSLEIREKKIEEQLQLLAEKGSQSFSSTQLSTDTYSTGFNKNSKELQQLLNEVTHEYQPTQLSLDGEFIGASFVPINCSSGSELDFAFMFSEPLVLAHMDSNQNIQKSPIPLQIDHFSEQEAVKTILRTSKNELKFRSFAATQAGLGECLNLKPRAIHFCGHGVKNTSDNFLFRRNDEGDFLIFEDEEGKADFMSCRALKNLLHEKKLEHSIDFAFVASCHSYLVGEVFREAGAKHVICIARDEKVLDKACQEFTKHFYQAYFTGNYSVCEAFRNAKEHLRSIKGLPPGEENKFEILFEDNLFESHICSSMFNVNKKSELNELGFRDLTPIPIFHKIPSRVEHFMGRQLELHETIKLIRSQRFVTIKGIPGIGKSSLCKEAAHFLLERNVFQDGIIYLSLSGCDSIEGIVSGLDSKLGYLSKDVNSKKESIGNIISQVANYLDQKVRDALIILDNVDQVHHKERGKFRELTEMILVTCPRVKILVTSRSPIGGGFQDAAEKVFTLSHLDANNARDLFFSKAPRSISDLEIKEFLEYKLSSSEEAFLLTSSNYVEQHVSKNRRNSGSFYSSTTNSSSFYSQLCMPYRGSTLISLEGHHLMQILGGHPQAISLAAGLLVERSLKDLYKLLTSHPILDVLKVEDLTADEMKSINSMQVSLDVSVNYLKKSHRDAVRFFGLLGLLPGGSQDADLTIIWGKDWEEHARLLLRYSLIIKSERSHAAPNTRYLLYPFMIEYAERRLKRTDIIEFTNKVLVYLKEKAEKIYNKVGSVSPESHIMFDVFLQEETNFKACLKRELEAMTKKKGKNTKHSSQEVFEETTFGLTKENLQLLDKYNSGKQEWVLKTIKEAIGFEKIEKYKKSRENDKQKSSKGAEKKILNSEGIDESVEFEEQEYDRSDQTQEQECNNVPKSDYKNDNDFKEEKEFIKEELNVNMNKLKIETSINQEEDVSLVSFGNESRKENDCPREIDHKKELNEDENFIMIENNLKAKIEETNKKEKEIQELNLSELGEGPEVWSAGIKMPTQTDDHYFQSKSEENNSKNTIKQNENKDIEKNISSNVSEQGLKQQTDSKKDTEKYAVSSFTSQASSFVYNTSEVSQTLRPLFKVPKTDQSATITGPESIGMFSGNEDASIEVFTPNCSNDVSPHKEKKSEAILATPTVLSIEAVNQSSNYKPTEIRELEHTPRFYSLGRNSSKESEFNSEKQGDIKSLDENFSNEDLLNSLELISKGLCQENLSFEDKAKKPNTPNNQEKQTSCKKKNLVSKNTEHILQENNTMLSNQEKLAEQEHSKSPITLSESPKNIKTSSNKIVEQNKKQKQTIFDKNTSLKDSKIIPDSVHMKNDPNHLIEINQVLESEISSNLTVDGSISLQPEIQKRTVSRQSVRRVSKQSNDREKNSKATTTSPNSQQDTPKTLSFMKKKPSSIVKTLPGASNTKNSLEKKLSFLFPGEKKATMLPACHLAVLYCSILFLLRRFNECERFIGQGLDLCRGYKDKLGEANLLKLKGCLNWIKKSFQNSFKDFTEAIELFQKAGCSLGQAICDAAIGYLKAHMFAEESAVITAIKSLETALVIYKQLGHLFGIHYMHRWLSIVKNKTPNFKSQSKNHSEEARKVLNLTNKKKEVYGSRHNAGYFVLRWMGDAFSIFLEVATICDLRPIKKAKEEPQISESVSTSLSVIASKPKSRTSFSGLSGSTTGNQARSSIQSGKTEESEEGRTNKQKLSSSIQSRSGITSGKNRSESKGQNLSHVSSAQKKDIPMKMLMPSLRQKKANLTQKAKEKERGREDIKEVKEEEKNEVFSTENSQEKRSSELIEKDGKLLKNGVKLCLEIDDLVDKPKNKTSRITPTSKDKNFENDRKRENIRNTTTKADQPTKNDSSLFINDNLSNRGSKISSNKRSEKRGSTTSQNQFFKNK